MKSNPKVDWYFTKGQKWQEEFLLLRSILLDMKMEEELKWGHPCYTMNGANIVLMHGFKEYCALLLFKGSLLKDPKKILVQQTANVQAARQIRFTSAQQIAKMRATIRSYVQEAIKVEKAGLKVEFKKTKEFAMPDEFKSALKKDKALEKAFYALTPGRQRGYFLYFSSAKQAATRESRIKKYAKSILNGKGIDD